MTSASSSQELLGMTSRWIAAVRAKESAREDRLFNDPYAAALAGKEGAEWLAQRSPDFTAPIIIRVRYFDDYLQNVAYEHGLRQFVLMGAGLDARAFRLNWPDGTRLFELDQPGVLEYKEKILRSLDAHETCARAVVGKNVTEDWREALLSSGFDPRQPSCWLLEGFLFYLPTQTITRLLDQITSLAASGSRLGFDIIDEAVLSSPYTKAWLTMQAESGAPWIGFLNDPEAFLAERGWEASLTQGGQPDANFGRWALPVIPVKTPALPHNWLVTAQKPSPQPCPRGEKKGTYGHTQT